jgi:hypothetical protein
MAFGPEHASRLGPARRGRSMIEGAPMYRWRKRPIPRDGEGSDLIEL